ncbi:hypothetical protein CC117_16775 [Parafrankia colletiae]|uniref:TIR domain-containing protein n=1 Tax=Parafrankia colletiae TaxID=573497 RepID=A0A1S1QX45_9ACTN|nr:hypothetical protein CC117_16775 [Parafrankia colletiae]
MFISYARGDAAVGGLLRERITEAGHHVFLDTDPDRGVRIGEDWEQRLYRELRAADALVAVVTSRYVVSSWCLAELAVARSRSAVLLPLLAEQGVALPLLSSLHYLDYVADPDRAAQAVLDELVRVDLGSGRGWAEGRNPYPGLEAFTDDRRSVFFGRDGDTQQVLARITAAIDGDDKVPDGGILLISGPSGVGKSSLLKAGIRPTVLDRQGWRALPVLTPGEDPVGALANAFLLASNRLGLGWRREDIGARLGDRRSFLGLVDEILAARPPCEHLLLVIDQFEELLVTTSAGRRARFADLVGGASSRRLQIVGTFRSEYEGLLRADAALRDVPVTWHFLEPLSRDALRMVIEEPAREAGLHFDNDLLARMVTDTAIGTALPLLAFTLWKLATDLERGGRITTGAYHQLGGVRGTIIHQADLALAQAARPAVTTEEQVLTTLLRLVSIDNRGQSIRVGVDRATLTPVQRTHLEPFVVQRLVTTQVVGDRTVLSVAHEAFLTAWPPLAERIAAEAATLRQRHEIERDATHWREAGRPASLLWTRPQLRAFLAASPPPDPADSASDEPTGRTPARRRILVRGRGPSHGGGQRRVNQPVAATSDLSADAVEFLRASVRRDRRLRARAISVLALLLVAALIGATVATAMSRSALRERRLAVSRGLIQEAVALRQSDPRVSLLLSIEAYRIAPTVQARGNLLSVQASYYADTLPRAGGPVHAVAYAPLRTHRMATAEHTGVVRVWSTTSTRRPPLMTLEHGSPVYSITFSADGRLLAAGEQDGTVSLWDVESQRLLQRNRPTGEAANEVAFHPDAEVLAVASANGNVYLLATTDLHEVGLARVGPGPVGTVAFNRTGALLAAAGTDATVSIFDTRTLLAAGPPAVTAGPTGPPGTAATPGPAATARPATAPGTRSPRAPLSVLPGHAATARAVTFSPVEDLLAVGSDDRTVRVWRMSDPGRPALFATFPGHTGAVGAVAFSPGGEVLASGDDDSSVRIWDVASRTVLTALSGPSEAVLSLAFSPDAHTLSGSGADGVTGLWHLSRPAPRDRPPAVGSVALTRRMAAPRTGSVDAGSPTVATAGTDRTIELWGTDPPVYLSSIEPPADPADVTTAEGPWAANALAFNSDGSRLAASRGAATGIFDPTGRTPPTELTDDMPRSDRDADVSVVNAVDFHPQEQRVVIGGTDNTVRLGNADTGQLGPPLYRHENVVNAVRFMPDGRTVASASDDGWVGLWDLGTSDPERVDLRGPGPMKSLAISTDGTMLAGGSDDGTVRLWTVSRPAPGQPYRQEGTGRTLTGTDQAVVSVAFSPDATLLAGAYTDGSVRVWDTRTGDLYALLTGRDASAVVFSADGSTLITTDHDGNLVTWLTDPDRVANEICAVAPALSEEEWSRYMPGDDYRRTCR